MHTQKPKHARCLPANERINGILFDTKGSSSAFLYYILPLLLATYRIAMAKKKILVITTKTIAIYDV